MSRGKLQATRDVAAAIFVLVAALTPCPGRGPRGQSREPGVAPVAHL